MTDLAFRALVVSAAVAAFALIARLSFCSGVSLPPIPPEPRAKRVAAAQVSQSVDHDPAIYAQALASDSRAFNIDPPATPASLSRAFPYEIADQPFALEPGAKSNSAVKLGLALTLGVEDIDGTPRRQMVLTIENTTDRFLAYRVTSRPSRGTSSCHDKADHAHNAIALAPGERIQRSECIYKRGWRLWIDRVETIELPELSYHYVSWAPPAALGLDLLSSRGHRGPDGRPACQVFQSATLQTAMTAGQVTWRDLCDFYARHSCANFSFPIDYKAFQQDGERPLPAVIVAR